MCAGSRPIDGVLPVLDQSLEHAPRRRADPRMGINQRSRQSVPCSGIVTEIAEHEGRDGSCRPQRVLCEYFVGEATILLAVGTVDGIPSLIEGPGVDTHALAAAPGGPEYSVEEATARRECDLNRIQRSQIIAHDCTQVLPGLRHSNRFISCWAMADSGTVFHADHDRIVAACQDIHSADGRRIRESEVLPHDDGTRMEGTVGIDSLDGVEQVLSPPTFQPDELDRAVRPRDDLTGTLRRRCHK